MPSPITLLSAGLCLGVLALRYYSQPKKQASTPKQRFKTAKILLLALAAWMAIGYTMRSMDEKIDGVAPHEPSLMQRIVFYFTK